MMRPELKEASVSADKFIGEDLYRAHGRYSGGSHGWDIDVFKNGKRIAMRNAAYAERDGGLDIVAETLAAVAEGRSLGNTYFF